MGAAAAGGAIASVGLSAYSSILKGQATKTADEYQAGRLERKAEIGRVAATQTAAQLDEQLATHLGNIDVVRAAAHTDPTSPTGAAVREYEQYVGGRQRNIAVENILSQTEQQDADAMYLRRAGDQALQLAYLDAAAGVLKGGASTSGGSFGLPGGGGGDGSDWKSQAAAALKG